MTFIALIPASKTKEHMPINIDRVRTLLRTMQPLTLPYCNREGDVMQLWATHKQELIGAVLRKSGGLCVIPAHKIYNPLGGNPNDLIESLGKSDLKAWDLVFDPIQKTLSIWPHLEGAARNKPLKDGAPLPSGHMKIKGSPLRHLTRDELIEKLVAKRDPRDPSRYLYEFRGNGDPKTGGGSFVNQQDKGPSAGRKWYFDPRDQGRYREPNHVDIESATGVTKLRFAYKDDRTNAKSILSSKVFSGTQGSIWKG